MERWTKPAHSWADVTLGEFEALHTVRDADAISRIEMYWRSEFEDGKYPFNDEPPKFADGAGKVFDEWRERLARIDDDPWASAVLAREVLAQLGTLTILQYRKWSVPA